MPHTKNAIGGGLLLTAGLSVGAVGAHPNHEHTDIPDEPDVVIAPASQPSDGRTPGGDEERRPAMRSIELPEPSVTIEVVGEHRMIRSNGIPSHATGTFPNAGNPNMIRAQRHTYRVPVTPVEASEPRPARPEFGVALNGVIMDSGTGEFWSPSGRRFGNPGRSGSEWNYEALGGGVPLGLDGNNAHVQPSGKYHYHGVPTGLLERLGGEAGIKRMLHVGWAADGYPIYGPFGYADPMDADSEIVELSSSYELREGARTQSPAGPGGVYDGTFTADYAYARGSGDLDECNGRFGVTPEFPGGTYYYVLTHDFPSIPRFWKGEPDASWQRGPGEGGRPDADKDRGRRGERRGRSGRSHRG